MAAQFYKINYKSDFVLTINSDAGWAVPFCIKFWTGMPSHGYFAGFDGENYVNCRVGETPTQLLVMFDDHHMPIGPLRMQIAYHTTIEEFPDRKFDEVTNPTNVTVDIDGTEYQVMLDFTGETGAEIDFSMPSSGVMSVNGKIGYVTLTAEDVGAQPTIEDLATIRSGAAEGATAVQPAEMTAALATKQDAIPDLANIRSGAAAGATAVQPATLQEGLATKQNVISDLATIRSGAAAGATAVQPAALQEGLATKQDVISDLSTIRSGAAAGATAVQPAALTPIESDIDAIEGKIPSAASTSNQLADKAFVNSALADKADTSDIPTALSQLSQDSTHRVVTDAEKSTWNGKQNAISDLATIRSGAAAGATAVQPAAMNTALAAKQDTLTFDNAPTANSNNPVKSSGIKTALDAKQSTISTVNVTVDNNTGTPSGSASVSGSTISLSFQNLKGATGATGATGPQGPQGERGLPGESGVTGDVSGFTVIQTIDPSATYGATDIAGAATVQATNAELTELSGELGIKQAYSPTWLDGGIDTEGSVTAAGNYFHTSPIHLGIGDTIYISTAGYGLSTISTTDSSGSSYTPQVIVTSGSSTALSTYQWTTTEDCYVSCCGKLLSADAPASIEIDRFGIMDNIPKLYDCIGQNSDGAINQATMTKLLTKGADSYSETKDVSDFHIYNGHNSNSGTWDTSYGKFIVIPTVGLDSVYLGTPTNQSLYWILLKSFTEPVSGGAIDFCDGFSSNQTIGPNVSTTISIPDDCNYLAVYRYLGTSNQYNVTPSSIVLNFKSVVGISGIEGSISTDTTMIGEMPIYAAENGYIYNNSTNVQICSKFIPVKASAKYRFSSSKYNILCILTSNTYTAGQSISNFATGESLRTISAGGNLELTTPSDAAYALLRTTAADGTAITISVTEITDVSTALTLCESQISEANDNIERVLYRDAANIRYSDFYDSSLSDNEVWDNILSATSFIPKKNIVIDRNMTISRVLYVGSNTTIYIDNVTIKQADNVFDNVFRGINEIPTTSEGYEIVAGENLELLENIKILGIGNARIEGPDSASKIATDSYGLRTVQVLFDRVKGLEIGNIAYSKTRGWCHCLMFVEDAYIHDILFDNLEDGANRDGFDFRSGCHDIVVENVGGRTGDDLFAFHAHNVSSLDGTREGYSKRGVRRYFCAQYIDKLNNENRLSELDVHDCRINNAYKYNGYWHVGICLAAHGTYTYNISITNINVGGHITSGQSYIQGLITLYKYGNYVDNHMHDILVSNIVNDSDSNMPVFNNDCKVSNVWVNKLVNNTTNKTADIQYGDGVTLLNTENYHRISGTFTQSGAALVNKDIVFTSSGVSYTAKTNSNGYNTFLPAGTYTVTCSGYTLSISSVTIGSSDVVQNISAT